MRGILKGSIFRTLVLVNETTLAVRPREVEEGIDVVDSIRKLVGERQPQRTWHGLAIGQGNNN